MYVHVWMYGYTHERQEPSASKIGDRRSEIGEKHDRSLMGYEGVRKELRARSGHACYRVHALNAAMPICSTAAMHTCTMQQCLYAYMQHVERQSMQNP
jgi:hypothetical protein